MLDKSILEWYIFLMCCTLKIKLINNLNINRKNNVIMKKMFFSFLLATLFFEVEAQHDMDYFIKNNPEKEVKALSAVKGLPIVVDHSAEMPVPLDQGSQGSCVCFAISYLKTWEEAKENGWDVNLLEHQFSPAFIYNSLHPIGSTAGKYESNPFDFVCQRGSITLDKFPYNEDDDTTQPSQELQYQALYFRDKGWGSTCDLEKAKEILIDRPIFSMINCSHAVSTVRYNSIHSVCIVGYNDTILINGKRGALRYINSYGPNWHGDNVT
ncbi:MAG TPA: hypothetical protein VFD16_00360, partial [Candidatus Saccharimonadales bacterium]|nr:hypothetical protein [Candidatus Saccharimonadales bacterium]